MKPGDHQRILTVSETIREAASVCDPEGTASAVTALYEAYEDDDRPATAVEDLRGELLSTVRGVDPEGDEPAASAAAATAVWLATNPAQAENGEHAMREGVRLVFEDRPPEALASWLADRDGSA